MSQKKTPAFMIQGCTSDAGKSVLCSAFCRIFANMGVKVRPFKAQNMALNAAVCDGGEIGRSQAVQAMACRVPADVRMNPILLKPTADTTAQIIVRGQAIQDMDVMGYIDYKRQGRAIACEAYDELAEEAELIILEGAGSPGEINLKKHDIVNMAMARHAEAPVILTGDIDRGGVYAHFIGHYTVFEQWERDLLRGFLVNRFRGDASLLDDAHVMVEAETHTPVVGVIPYLHNMGLPEEDAVRLTRGPNRAPPHLLDIVVIDVPHIANATDIDPLLVEPDVSVRIVRNPGDLGDPDLIILPGSKNVRDDFCAIQSSGIVGAIEQKAQNIPILGICGGMQMLGLSIADPHGVEGAAGKESGMGLLPIETTLASGKELQECKACTTDGMSVHGYEIHHGATDSNGALPWMTRTDGQTIGWQHEHSFIRGTYLHGLFDDDVARGHLLNELRQRRGQPALNLPSGVYDVDAAIERLAEHVQKNVDMKVFLEMAGI